MKTILLTQDRDEAILYNPEQPLVTIPVIVDGKIFGINLMYNNHLLGTFDSCNEAIEEIGKIASSTDPVYCMSGYSDYDGSIDFWTSVAESLEIDLS